MADNAALPSVDANALAQLIGVTPKRSALLGWRTASGASFWAAVCRMYAAARGIY